MKLALVPLALSALLAGCSDRDPIRETAACEIETRRTYPSGDFTDRHLQDFMLLCMRSKGFELKEEKTCVDPDYNVTVAFCYHR